MNGSEWLSEWLSGSPPSVPKKRKLPDCLRKVVSRPGVEPGTSRLRVCCSAN